MNTTLNHNRSLNLFIVAGIVIAFVVVTGLGITSSAKVTTNVAPNVSQDIAENTNVALAPLSADAFPQYRQSEWNSIAVPVTGVSGVESYHQSERTLIPEQAGLITYQLSERTLVNPLADYLASERTLSPIMNPDFSLYQISERTMTESVAIPDLSQYFVSERTSIPVQFTPYQISEWFGK